MDPNQQPQQPPQPQPQPLQPQFTQVPVPEPGPYPQPPTPQPQPPFPPEAAPVTPPVTPPIAPVATQQPFEAQSHPTPERQSQTRGSNPGKTLGVISFALLFVALGLISLILGIIGLKKSKRAGHGNVFAVIGIVGGILEILTAIAVSALFIMSTLTAIDTCKEYGSGTHTLIDGQTITCNI